MKQTYLDELESTVMQSSINAFFFLMWALPGYMHCGFYNSMSLAFTCYVISLHREEQQYSYQVGRLT